MLDVSLMSKNRCVWRCVDEGQLHRHVHEHPTRAEDGDLPPSLIRIPNAIYIRRDRSKTKQPQRGITAVRSR